ncbi:MAG: cyclic nucleotide-binding domain-containing protein [Rhodospirillales bacterium]|nr:cyclic nucleotide-binding domain-containing protein [Rhodospirillales bacterium]
MYVDGGTLKKSFFKQGDIIFKEGDAGDAAYIVETGSIGIFKTVDGADLQLATIRVGELFGEMAIIDGSKRMAHAVALEESVIVNVPSAGIAAMLAKQPPMIKTLIQILVDSLRNVHDVYMKRPRSLGDSVTAICASADALRKFLNRHPDADLSGEARRRIDEVDAHATVLHDLVGGWNDPRANVIDDATAPPAGKAGKPAGDG